MRFDLAIFPMFVLFLAPTAQAFEPATHEEISFDAFQLLERCEPALVHHFPSNRINISLESARTIARGSRIEDTTELYSRLKNWHFYDRSRNLRHGFFEESLDGIFERRNRQYRAGADRADETLGRIVHYIQDMFVPARVVPIFHGGPFGRHDEFDGYKVSETLRQEALASIRCDELFGEAALTLERAARDRASRFSLNRYILDRSAQRTLRTLKTKIPGTDYTWNIFWRDPVAMVPKDEDTSSWRAIFGAKADRFGTYEGHFGANTGGVVLRTFDNFYLSQYQGAVQASAEIILINRLIETPDPAETTGQP